MDLDISRIGFVSIFNYTCARLSHDLEMVTGLGRLREGGRDIVIEVGRGPSTPGGGASGGVDDEECRDLNKKKQNLIVEKLLSHLKNNMSPLELKFKGSFIYIYDFLLLLIILITSM